MQELQGAHIQGALCCLHLPFTQPTSQLTVNCSLLKRMVIQHVSDSAYITRLVPPVRLLYWTLNSMLKVWDHMLTPSWGGVLLGGKGCVKCLGYSYGKRIIVKYLICTGVRVAYNKGKKYNVQEQNCGIYEMCIDLVLPCWSDRIEMSPENT